MQSAVLVRESRETAPETAAVVVERPRSGLALAAMVGGLLFVIGSVLAGGLALREDSRPFRPVQAEPAAGAHETPGFPDVGVANNSYVPGHSSGWHVHPGVHSAVVLSGTLTVYEADCSRHDYGPGQTYLGGRDAHVAKNETSEPVELVVTYVFQTTSPLDHATAVPAPAGCAVR